VIVGISTVNISANVMDSGVVSEVEFLVDGESVAQFTASPFTYTYTISDDAGRQIVVSARAQDLSGNISISNSVTLNATMKLTEITEQLAPYTYYTSANTIGAEFTAYDMYVLGDAVTDQQNLPTDVAPKYAYVANNNTIMVLDLVNRVGYRYNAGTAYNIDVVGDFAYVARTSSGLGIYYIANPTTPLQSGNFTLSGSYGYVYDVKIRGKYAFLAAYYQQLQIVDISNISEGGLPLTTATWVGEKYYSSKSSSYYITWGIELLNNMAFSAMEYYYYDYLSVLSVDISSPTTLTGTTSNLVTGNSYERPYDIVAIDERYFILVGGDYIDLYDASTATMSATPTRKSSTNFSGHYYENTGVVSAGNLVFALTNSTARGVDVFDVTNRTTPTLMGTKQYSSGDFRAIDIYGNMLFVSQYNSGIRVYEIDTFDDETPVVNIVSHSADASVQENVTERFVVEVPNENGVTVEFLRNGKPYTKDFVKPYDLYYVTRGAEQFTLQARAIDLSGNVGYSELITINVEADTVVPIVQSVTNGQDGTLGQSIGVTINVTDNIAVDRIQIASNQAEPATLYTPTSAPDKRSVEFSYNFTITLAEDPVLYITPYDTTGNAGDVFVYTVNYADNVAPELNITSPAPGTIISANTNVTIGYTVRDLGTVPSINTIEILVDDVRVYYNDNYTGNPATTTSLSMNYLVPADKLSSVVNITVKVTDDELLMSEASTSVEPQYRYYGSVRNAYYYKYDVKVKGKYLYAASSSSYGFEVFDLDTLTSIKRLSLNSNTIYNFEFVGNYAYVTTYSGCFIIDISVPANMSVVAKISNVEAEYMQVNGNYVYLFDYGSIFVYDVSKPTEPELLGVYPYTPSGYYARSSVIDPSGNYMYIGTGSDISVYDVSDPTKVIFIKQFETAYSNACYGLAIKDNKLYASKYSYGLVMYDISDPANPVREQHIALSNPCRHVEAFGNYIYWGYYTEIRVYEKDTLRFVTSFTPNSGYYQWGTYAFGNYLYGYSDYYSAGLNVLNFDVGAAPPVIEDFNVALNGMEFNVDVTVSDDDQAVVQLIQNGEIVDSTRETPYQFKVPIKVTDTGLTMEFQVRALDLAGNVVNSSVQSLSIPEDVTGPVVTLVSPADGSDIAENTSIDVVVSVTDDLLVRSVELLVDAGAGFVVTDVVTEFEDLSAVSLALTMPDASVSSVTCKVRALDGIGNTSESAEFQYNIVEDSEAPTISIVSPSDGDSVYANDVVRIEVDASDAGTVFGSIESVAFYADDMIIGTIDGDESAYYWNVPADMANSTVTIKAVAYDHNSLSAEASVNVNVGNAVKEYLFAADSYCNVVNVVNLHTGVIDHTIYDLYNVTYSKRVVASQDGTIIYVYGNNQYVVQIDPVTLKTTQLTSFTGNSIYSLEITSDGKLAYVLDSGGVIHIINTATGEKTGTVPTETGSYSTLYDMRLSPDNTKMYLRYYRYTGYVDLNTYTSKIVNMPNNNRTSRIAVTGDGLELYVLDMYDYRVLVYDALTMEMKSIITLNQDNGAYIETAQTPSGTMIYVCDDDYYIMKIDGTTKQRDNQMLSLFGYVYGMTIPAAKQSRMYVSSYSRSGETYQGGELDLGAIPTEEAPGFSFIHIIDTETGRAIDSIPGVYGSEGVGYVRYILDADTVAPVVSIAQPTASTFPKNSDLTVTAAITENRTVDTVQFFFDGKFIGSKQSAPYSMTFRLPNTSVPLIGKVIEVVAFDSAGNRGAVSKSIDILPGSTAVLDTVDPTISFDSLADGNMVFTGKTLVVKLNADDNQGIDHIELFKNDELVATDMYDPFVTGFRVDEQPGEMIRLSATAYDMSGNTASTGEITLSVIEDNIVGSNDVMIRSFWYNGYPELYLYSSTTHEKIKQYDFAHYCRNAVLTKDGRYIYAIAAAGTYQYEYRIYQINTSTGAVERNLYVDYDYDYTYGMSLEMTGDGNALMLVSANYDWIKYYSIKGNTQITYIMTLTDNSGGMDWPINIMRTDDDAYIFVCANSRLLVFDGMTGMHITTIMMKDPGSTSTYTPYTVGYIPGLPYAYVGVNSNRIFVVDLDKMAVKSMITGFTSGSIYGIAAGYTPEGPKVFACDNSYEMLYKLNAHTLQVEGQSTIPMVDSDYCTLNQTGTAVYIASLDGYTPVVMDAVTLQLLKTMPETQTMRVPFKAGRMIDTVAPSISVTNPLAGDSILEGKYVDVTVEASDNTAVKQVDLKVGGKVVAQSTVSPFMLTYRMPEHDGQPLLLQAVAVDYANNVATSTPVTVTILQDVVAPTVAISDPVAGTSVPLYSEFDLTVDFTDNAGVDLYVTVNNKGFMFTDVQSSPYVAPVAVEDSVIGSVIPVTVTAVDLGGNVASAAITINVTEPLFDMALAVLRNERELVQVSPNGSYTRINQPGGTESGQFMDVALTSNGQYAFVVQTPNKVKVYQLPEGTLIREITDTVTNQYGELASIIIDKDDRFAYASRYQTSYSPAAGMIVIDVPTAIDPNSTANPVWTYTNTAGGFYGYTDTFTRPNLLMSDSGAKLWVTSSSSYSSSYHYTRMFDVSNMANMQNSYFSYWTRVSAAYDAAVYNNLVYWVNYQNLYVYNAETGGSVRSRSYSDYFSGVDIGVVNEEPLLALCDRSSPYSIMLFDLPSAAVSNTPKYQVTIPYLPMDVDFNSDGSKLYVYYASNPGFSIIDTSDWSIATYSSSSYFRRFATYKATDGESPTVELSLVPEKQTFFVGEIATIKATVEDNKGGSKVDYYFDGEYYATAYAPFELKFVTTESDNDGFSVQAKAFDFAGNSAWSNTVTFNSVADVTPPEITISTLQNLTNINAGSPILVVASATDDAVVEKITLTIEEEGIGTRRFELSETPYEFIIYLDDNMLNGQEFTVSAVATDVSGNEGTSNILNGSVFKDTAVYVPMVYAVSNSTRLTITQDTSLIDHIMSVPLNSLMRTVTGIPYVFMLRQSNNQVVIFDKATHTLLKSINNIEGPSAVAFDKTRNVAYVTCRYSHRVVVISLDTLEVIAEIANTSSHLSNPVDLAVTPDGNYLYVLNYQTALDNAIAVVYDLNDNYAESKIYTLSSGIYFANMAMSQGGQNVYACTTGNLVYAMDVNSTDISVRYSDFGNEKLRVSLTPAGMQLFVVKNNTYVYSRKLSTNESRLLYSGNTVYDMLVSDDGRYLYLGTYENSYYGIKKIDSVTGASLGWINVDQNSIYEDSMAYTMYPAYDTSLPVVALNNVPAEAYEGSTVRVAVDVTSKLQIKKVDLLMNGDVIAENVIQPFGFDVEIPLDVTSVTLQAKAYTVVNTNSVSAEHTITVNEDLTAPVVDIVIPSDGDTVFAGRMLTVKSDVTEDANNIESVTLKVNGQIVDSSFNAPYTMHYFVPRDMATSTLLIEVTAQNASGLSASDSVSVNISKDAYEIMLAVTRMGDILTLDLNTLDSIMQLNEDTIRFNSNTVIKDAAVYFGSDVLYTAQYDTYEGREMLGVTNLNTLATSHLLGEYWDEPRSILLTDDRFAVFDTQYNAYASVFSLNSMSWVENNSSIYCYSGGRGLEYDSAARSLYVAHGNYYTPSRILTKYINVDFNLSSYGAEYLYTSNLVATSMALSPDKTQVYLGTYDVSNPGATCAVRIVRTASPISIINTVPVDAEVTSIMAMQITDNLRVLAAMPAIDQIAIIDPVSATVVKTWNVNNCSQIKRLDGIDSVIYTYEADGTTVNAVDVVTGAVVATNDISRVVSLLKTNLYVFPDTEIPSITIVEPAPDATYYESHWMTIAYSASDNRELTSVEVLIDDILVDTMQPNESEYIFRLPLIDTASISMKIQLRAYDRSGNIARTDARYITIVDDTEAPVATLSEPVNGDSIIAGFPINVVGFATDNSGSTKMINRIQIFVENDLFVDFGASDAGTFATSITIPADTYGTSVTVAAVAYDYAGNSSDRAEATLNISFGVTEPTSYSTSNINATYALDNRLFVAANQSLLLYDLSEGDGGYDGGELGFSGELSFVPSETEFLDGVPSSMTQIAGIGMKYPYSAYGMVVDNGYIYTVAAPQHSYNNTELQVYKYDPAVPYMSFTTAIQVADYNVRNDFSYVDLMIEGNRAYLPLNHGIVVCDLTLPFAPTVLTTITDADNDGFMSLDCDMDYLYALTLSGKLHVYDIITLELVATVQVFDGTENKCYYSSVEVLDSTIYVGAYEYGFFRMTLSKDPLAVSDPVTIDSVLEPDDINGVNVVGDMAVLYGYQHAALYDVSVPGSETSYGVLLTDSDILNAYFYGNAMVLRMTNQIVIYHISGYNVAPASIELVLPENDEDRHYESSSVVEIPFLISGTNATVELLVDGTPVSTMDDSGHEFARLMMPLNLPHITVSARLLDLAGNAYDSIPVTVFVDLETEVPTNVEITTSVIPGDSLYAGDSFSFDSTATDNIGIDRIEFLINGNPFVSVGDTPYQAGYMIPLDYNSDEIAVQARAYDYAGNSTLSEQVTFAVIILSGIEAKASSLIYDTTAVELFGTFTDGRQIDITDYAADDMTISVNSADGIVFNNRILRALNPDGDIEISIIYGSYSDTITQSVDLNRNGIAGTLDPSLGLDDEIMNSDYGIVTDMMEVLADGTDPYDGADDWNYTLTSYVELTDLAVEQISNGVVIISDQWGTLYYKFRDTAGEAPYDEGLYSVNRIFSYTDLFDVDKTSDEQIVVLFGSNYNGMVLGVLRPEYQGQYGGGELSFTVPGGYDGYDNTFYSFTTLSYNQYVYAPAVEVGDNDGLHLVWADLVREETNLNTIHYSKYNADGTTAIEDTVIYQYDVNQDMLNGTIGYGNPLPNDMVRDTDITLDNDGNVHIVWLSHEYDEANYKANYKLYYKMLDGSDGSLLIDTSLLAAHATMTNPDTSRKLFVECEYDNDNGEILVLYTIGDLRNGTNNRILRLAKLKPANIANKNGSSVVASAIVESNEKVPGQSGIDTHFGNLEVLNGEVHVVFSESVLNNPFTLPGYWYSQEESNFNYLSLSEYGSGDMYYQGRTHYFSWYEDGGTIYMTDSFGGSFSAELQISTYAQAMQVEGSVTYLPYGYDGYDSTPVTDTIDPLLMTRESYEGNNPTVMKYYRASDSLPIESGVVFEETGYDGMNYFQYDAIDLYVDPVTSDLGFVYNYTYNPWSADLKAHLPFNVGGYDGGGGPAYLQPGEGDEVSEKPMSNPGFENGNLDGYSVQNNVWIVEDLLGLGALHGNKMAVIADNSQLTLNAVTVPKDVEKMYFNFSFIIQAASLQDDNKPKVVAKITSGDTSKTVTLADSSKEASELSLLPYILLDDIEKLEPEESHTFDLSFSNPKGIKFRFDIFAEAAVEGKQTDVTGITTLNVGAGQIVRSTGRTKYSVTLTNNSSYLITGPVKVFVKLTHEDVSLVDSHLGDEFDIIVHGKRAELDMSSFAGTGNPVSVSIYSDTSEGMIAVDNFRWDNTIENRQDRVKPYTTIRLLDRSSRYADSYSVGSAANFVVEALDAGEIDHMDIVVDGEAIYTTVDETTSFGYSYYIPSSKKGSVISVQSRVVDQNGNRSLSRPVLIQVK